jgi:hypothetical protein
MRSTASPTPDRWRQRFHIAVARAVSNRRMGHFLSWKIGPQPRRMGCPLNGVDRKANAPLVGGMGCVRPNKPPQAVLSHVPFWAMHTPCAGCRALPGQAALMRAGHLSGRALLPEQPQTRPIRPVSHSWPVSLIGKSPCEPHWLKGHQGPWKFIVDPFGFL